MISKNFLKFNPHIHNQTHILLIPKMSKNSSSNSNSNSNNNENYKTTFEYYAKPAIYNPNNICLFSYGNVSKSKSTWKLTFSGYHEDSIGIAAGAAILYDKQDNIIWKLDKVFGNNITKNIAEYEALLLGLENLPQLSSIKIQGASELVMKQLAGIYEMRNSTLRKLHDLTLDLLFDKECAFAFHHVSYMHNKPVIQLSKVKISMIIDKLKFDENYFDENIFMY